MCGRFVSSQSPQQLADYFGASIDTDPLAPSYNVAPTNDIYAVVADIEGEPVVRSFHWGLVPVWAKDVKVGSRMINARAETLAEKPSFKTLFKSRRLIVPMAGFYEWKTVPGQKAKQPVFIHRADDEPLAVAGLWTVWRDKAAGPDAPWLHSCTVITVAANDTMATVHDRMPAILPEQAWEAWLDPDRHDVAELAQLLRPAPDDLLELVEVSTAVNSVRNKGAELIEPLQH
ncbi:MAG: SOS response-associated peptidase [Actinomycetota bacterium]|jgi:putative SOS response-associated peptidase YedK